MAKQKIDLRDELRSYKFEFDVLQKIPCTKQENKEYAKLLKEGASLPEGVFAYTYEGEASPTEFYTVYEPDLTEAEIREYLAYDQASSIRTIKNCVIFFTIIAVIILTVLALYLFLLVINPI